MYTPFRVGHRRRIEHNRCPKREYLLVEELRYIYKKQLGIRTSQRVMLVPKLTCIGECSTFPTYISPLHFFFQYPTCIQRQAATKHTASSAVASSGIAPRAGEEDRQVTFPWVLFLSPTGIGCSLSVISVFCRFLFTLFYYSTLL